MKNNQPIRLGLEEINRFQIDMRNKNRILLPEFGILNAVDEEIRMRMVRGLPYRLTEGRIVLLLKGEGIMHVRLQTFHVKAPAVVILSPGVIAQIEDISKAEQVRFLVFQNDFICEPKPSDLLQKYLNGMLNVFLPLKEEEALCVEQYYRTIWQTLQTKGWQREVIRHLVFGLFHYLSCLLQEQMLYEEKHQSRQEQVFNQFIQLVNQYASQERNVSFYADKLCLTPRYLNSLIRQASNRTVMDWINEAVIIEAKVLLKYSNKLIYQIADELNFPNTSFFCKFFKRMTGMTPLAYQKS